MISWCGHFLFLLFNWIWTLQAVDYEWGHCGHEFESSVCFINELHSRTHANRVVAFLHLLVTRRNCRFCLEKHSSWLDHCCTDFTLGCVRFLEQLSHLSFLCSLPVGRKPGRCQEATAGRDVEESGRREPPADPEGGDGVPEEHLQRGSYSSPPPFYSYSTVSVICPTFHLPQDIDSLPTTYLFCFTPFRFVSADPISLLHFIAY